MFPAAALLLLASAALLGLVVGDSPAVTLLAVGGAFALGRTARPPVIVAAGVLAAAGLAGAAAAQPHRDYTAANDFVWFLLAEIGMPAIVGRLLALRRQRAVRLRERAEALAAARDRRTALAEFDERLRLGVALQLTVAQRVGEIAVCAAAAEQARAADPDRARAVLAQVEATARTILADIRDLLGWLRHSEEVVPPVTPAEAKASPLRLDAAIAFALAVAFAVEVAGADYRRSGLVVNALLIVVTVTPLAWRRRAPLAVGAAVLAGVAAMNAFATPLSPLATPVALLGLLPYGIGAYLPRRAAAAGLVLASVGSVLSELVTPAAVRHDSSIAAISVVVAVAWVAGRWVRRHDRDLRSASGDADRAAAELAMAERLAVTRERARVARELHDVIAHAMTAVVLQAAAAQRVWNVDRRGARSALEAVAEVVGEALAYVEHALPSGDTRLAREDLARLVARAQANGLRVSLDVDAPTASAVVETAACRTVQEALTNAARHAAGATVGVRVHATGGDLRVEIVNDAGESGPLFRGGYGLRGMRERVEECGGRLETGPRPDGGFRVCAILPL